MTTGPSNEARRIAAAVQEIWKAIYVDADIVQIDVQSYSATLRNGDFDIAAGGWVADFNDARNFLFLLMTGNEMNYGRYSSAEFDALIRRSDQEQDLTKRGALLADAERLALKDVAWIPTRFQLTLNLVRPYVKGWVTNVNDKNRTRWLSIDRSTANG
jgi:oligopeptide transport system substrate-binding protein